MRISDWSSDVCSSDLPRLGSIVGYSTAMSAAAVIKKAGTLDMEKLVAAMKGLQVETPLGKVTYRTQDHQSTMGAYVGRIGLKDGKGIMTDRKSTRLNSSH